MLPVAVLLLFWCNTEINAGTAVRGSIPFELNCRRPPAHQDRSSDRSPQYYAIAGAQRATKGLGNNLLYFSGMKIQTNGYFFRSKYRTSFLHILQLSTTSPPPQDVVS